MTYIFGDLGRSWAIFRDLGSKCKILLGSRGNYFQGSGEINALFSGIKGAQTPPGGPQPSGSGEEDFLRVFTIYGHVGHLGQVTKTICINLG